MKPLREKSLREIVVDIFAWVLKNAVGLIAGVALMSFLCEKEPVVETRFVTDSAAVKEANDKAEAFRGREVGFIKKILGLEKQLQATEIIAGKDDPFDFTPPPLIMKTDTIYQEQSYPYDLIYHGHLTRTSLEIFALNPYLKVLGGEYVRIYRYALPENWDALQFGSVQSESLTVPGVKVSLERDFVRWNGLWFGSTLDYQRGLLFELDGRASFYSVELFGRLTTEPSISIGARYRVW